MNKLLLTPRRILISVDTVGGVWDYVSDLSQALAAEGVEVLIAVMGPESTLERAKELNGVLGIEVLARPYRLEWMTEPWDDIIEARVWLRDLELLFKPDVIHLNQFTCGSSLHDAPVLIVAHSCVFSWHHALHFAHPGVGWVRYQSEVSRGLCLADGVTAFSRAILHELSRNYGDFLAMNPVRNGYMRSNVEPSTPMPYILCTGRLWDEGKNIQLLNNVAPDIPWTIRAAGPISFCDLPTVFDFSNLELLGELSSEVTQIQMSRAAIYAVPAYYEPFGLGILEAARLGCALVLADIPSLRANWQGVALFLDPEDIRAWRQCLYRLCQNPGEVEALARSARLRAESSRFDVSTMVSSHMNHYSFLMDSTSKVRNYLQSAALVTANG